jgi:hypothetical protein
LNIKKPDPIIHIELSYDEYHAFLIRVGIRSVAEFIEDDIVAGEPEPAINEYRYFKLPTRILDALVKYGVITHYEITRLAYERETPEGDFVREESPDPSEFVNVRLFTSDGAYHDIRFHPYKIQIVILSYYKTNNHDLAIHKAKEFAIILMESIQRAATAPERSNFMNIASLHRTLRGNSTRSSAMHRVYNTPGLGEYAMSFFPRTTRRNNRGSLRLDPNVSAAKHAFTRGHTIVEQFAQKLMAQAPEIDIGFSSYNYVFKDLYRR